MSRHVQRTPGQRRERPGRRVDPAVLGTVAVAVVLLVVATAFLAWGRVADPEPGAQPVAGQGPTTGTAGTPATTPAPTATTTDAAADEAESAGASAAAHPVVRHHVGRQEVVPGVRLERAPRIRVPELEPVPTTFRVSTFNVLGASHTQGPHARKGFGPGVSRMRYAVQLLNGAGVDVVGFQELQSPQHNVFRAAAPGWQVYPGASLGQASMANSLAWRTDVWSLEQASSMQVPYFHGRAVAMPYVLLRNLATGRTVWFFNTHNPADAYGPAQQYRDRAVALEIGLARRLGADGTPVVFTGDMNDRAPYFCPMTTQTDMHAANGGSTGSPCRLPPATNVDWIMGNSAITFSNFHSDYTPLVRRTTDHHFVWADATVPAAGE